MLMVLYNFRKDLENLINNSGLTIDAAYFVLKDVMSEINELYKEAVAAASYKENAAAGQPSAEVAVAAQEENKTNE